MKMDFEIFHRQMRILMMLDNLDESKITEYMNEWYEIYKGILNNVDEHMTILQWATSQFNPKEVNMDTHDFWIDARGAAILILAKNVDGKQDEIIKYGGVLNT